jgi:hypothetical protein
MTSQINPSNIDGTYPIAGQDNNSQGFRTNFTNTSTNFQYAAQEITDLQSKAVLKAALSGTTLNNDMNGSPLSNAVLSDMAEEVVSLGSLTGTIPVDYSAGPVQTVTLGASGTLSFTNWPVSGTSGTVTVSVTVTNTAYTLTLPTAVSVNAVGIQGYASNVITFAAAGTYAFTFSTIDAGTTIRVAETNKALQPYNASSNTVASGAACGLSTTTSYFTTAGTATLAAGVNGQIKVLTQTFAGSMVVTVTNAGWKTSGTGTATLGAIGSSCTLQYTNSKWYCIGNNGAVFA